jgi:hypothetical protein
MKTNVLMKRPLFGHEIEQRTDNGFLNATQLERFGNSIRLKNDIPMYEVKDWLKTKQTKEFITELEKEFGKVFFRANKKLWMHPLLFIDYALALDPKLKIEVYKWMYDELIKNRHNSGDSYKAMSGALWVHCKNKAKFQKAMAALAIKNKAILNIIDWETATEKQLKQREDLQKMITSFVNVMNDNREAIRLSFIAWEKQL